MQPQPSPPLAIRSPRTSSTKKRALLVADSSSMDADVIEIPPPFSRSSKPMKQKEALVYEIIDIESDEEIDNSGIIQKELKGKGKAMMDISHSPLNGYSKESLPGYIYIPPIGFVGEENETEPGIKEELPHTSVADGMIYDLTADDDDDYMDYIFEDAFHVDNDYDLLLQAHFDTMDVPPGVEAPVPWLPGMVKSEMKSDGVNSVHSSGSLLAETEGVLKEAESFGVTESAQFEMSSTYTSTSYSHGQASSLSQPPQMDQSTPWLSMLSMHSKKNRARSQRKSSSKKFSFGLESFKSRRLLESFRNKKPPVSSSNSTNFSPPNQLAGFKNPSKSDTPNWGPSMPVGINKETVLHGSSFSCSLPTVPGSSSYPSFPPQIFLKDKTSTDPPKTWLKDPSKYSFNHSYTSAYSSYVQPFAPSVHTLPEKEVDSQLPQSLSGSNTDGIADMLRRLENFKHFDTVQDHSDHHYNDSEVKRPSKSWTKRIQEEWKILQKDLPDTIYIRVYETRMDILRAVIVGAEGTPYHDGLYFFDAFFPSGYPKCPPQVYYHSRGIRLNPNLYNCGKVCLSLLNTWSGQKNEKWMPGVSTMLQVLVSIQGLILNEKPYFNEPGFENSQGSANGEKMSLKYNEDTFILSLRTMTYMIRKPPKHFEDFVTGHFFRRANDILTACKAYMEGSLVGSPVRGVPSIHVGEKDCSSEFQQTLGAYVRILVKAFMEIGVKDCEKFLDLPPPIKEIKRQVGGFTLIDPQFPVI
ncbi:hypothetical protein SAY87_021317 [Trapa incisa]|uniref:E2 ubiquitin-conjugating enzyme n=1 Tax=Trapa incisa TaxID=236973 RepID=A0AAN7JS86_9MYRT|nr:hypothetical protein SAY87_021317 [Trapa incisa]